MQANALQGMPLLVHLVIGVTDQRRKTFFATGSFNPAEYVDGVGIGDIGDNKPDKTGSATLEAARHNAGAVVEVGNRLLNTCQ